MTSKLKFRLLSCSSQDPDHPIFDLINNINDWQSVRFCSFPQEIIIQFISPVIVKQIQLLSHQFKISSKITILSYLADPNDPNGNSEIKFKKLGFLTFDSNEKNLFKSRELKSVYLEEPCLYMKLVLMKNHMNKFNVFNQIGLGLISIYGDIYSSDKIIQIPQQNDLILPQIDETTLDRIKSLQIAKENAVKAEDYEKAKKIKQSIDKLKAARGYLLTLEQKKAKAIALEDYDSANIITSEIHKIKNSISSESLINEELPKIQSEKKINNLNRSEQEIINKIDGKDNDIDEEIPEIEEEIIPKQENFDDKFEFSLNQQVNKSLFKASYDEQIIPTMQKNKKNEIFDDSPIKYPEKPEKLSSKAQKQAETFQPFLTQEHCELLFSKVWQHREEALKMIQTQMNQIGSKEDSLNYYITFFGVIAHIFKEKIIQLITLSSDILLDLLKKNLKISRNDFNAYLDSITLSLIEKISENNQKIKQISEKTFFEMCKSTTIGLSYCVNSIAKLSEQSKTSNSPKFLLARLDLLAKVINNYKKSPEININVILDIVIKGLDHSNQDVRKKGMEVVNLIYNIYGEGKIKSQLESWNPGFLDNLKQEEKKTENKHGGKQKV